MSVNVPLSGWGENHIYWLQLNLGPLFVWLFNLIMFMHFDTINNAHHRLYPKLAELLSCPSLEISQGFKLDWTLLLVSSTIFIQCYWAAGGSRTVLTCPEARHRTPSQLLLLCRCPWPLDHRQEWKSRSLLQGTFISVSQPCFKQQAAISRLH